MQEIDDGQQADCPACGNPLITSSSHAQPECPHQHRRPHMAKRKKKKPY